MKNCITNKLKASIKLTHIKVTNESHLHNVPSGAESHFKVILVNNDFIKKTPVKRHQLVYSILAEELSCSLHALALHTYTELEWDKRQTLIPKTPNCLGAKHK